MPTDNPEMQCEAPDCNNVRKRLGNSSPGKSRYSKLCSTHHRSKYGLKRRRGPKDHPRYGARDLGVTMLPCSRCGWDKSYCDRHRLDPSGDYSPENVVPLCPNCHREITMGPKREAVA